MKKLIAGALALIAFTAFAVIVLATPSNLLYLLNWGEYIDMSLVERFEKENHCQVILETVTSSEAMVQKITSGTTPYDVAVPGDYAVQTLYAQGRLKELDVDSSLYPHLNAYRTMFSSSLTNLTSTWMKDAQGKGYSSYYMPYFWGSYAIFYSQNNPEVGEKVRQYGLESLYNPDLYSSKPKAGMYDVARWVVSSALMADGLDPNATDLDGSSALEDLSSPLQEKLVNQIRNAGFYEFGNDSLKRDCANGFIDLCFSQLGDYFDALYLLLQEGKQPQFEVSVPKTTAAFFDSLVIPSTSKNPSLANAFIDFMMDPEVAYQNARSVGYSPTLKKTCEFFEEESEKGSFYFGQEGQSGSMSLAEFLDHYPVYLDPLGGVENAYLFEPKSNRYLTTCESVFNRALA